MTFLRAVDTLAGAVRAQASGSLDDYVSKTLLARKIEVRGAGRGERGRAGPGSPGREGVPGGSRVQASLTRIPASARPPRT